MSEPFIMKPAKLIERGTLRKAFGYGQPFTTGYAVGYAFRNFLS